MIEDNDYVVRFRVLPFDHEEDELHEDDPDLDELEEGDIDDDIDDIDHDYDDDADGDDLDD